MGVMRPAGTVNVQDGGRSSNETGEARSSKVQAMDGGRRVRGPRPSWYYSSTQHSGLGAYIVLRVESRVYGAATVTVTLPRRRTRTATVF